jgi:hypothetical protein
MAHVLVTLIEDGCMGSTDRIDCKDLASAEALADSFENTEMKRGIGCVGCVKVGDKIKRVF